MTADPIAETAEWVRVRRNARRLGRVRMTEEFFEDLSDAQRAAFGESVKSEWNWPLGFNEFLFRGAMYDAVPEGEDPPLYELVTESENGRLTKLEVRKCQT